MKDSSNNEDFRYSSRRTRYLLTSTEFIFLIIFYLIFISMFDILDKFLNNLTSSILKDCAKELFLIITKIMCNISPEELNIYEDQNNCPRRIANNNFFLLLFMKVWDIHIVLEELNIYHQASSKDGKNHDPPWNW